MLMNAFREPTSLAQLVTNRESMAPVFLSAASSYHRLTASAALVVATMSIPLQAGAQQGPAPTADPATGGSATPPATAKSNAAAPTVEECLESHREAQALRKQFRLIESRDLLTECSNAACPGPVRRDCLRWVEEISQQLPSVVFRIDASEGESNRVVKIYVDNELRFQSMPSRAVEFNPGTYRLRFVMDGKDPVEQEVVLGEAEKFKSVTVKFPMPPKPGEETPTPVVTEGAKPLAPLPNPPATEQRRSIPLGSYIFAGLGVAAAINFTSWGLSSRALKSELENKCAPNCEQEYIDRVRFRAMVADISLGVGVASLATATVLYFLQPTTSVPVEVNVGMLPRGGVVGTVRVNNF
jgi:hypothetical protein